MLRKFPLLFLACLAACTSNPASGGHTFSLVTSREEHALGEAAASSVIKTYGLYRPESATSQYVVNLCNRVYAATEAAAAEPVKCNFVDDGSFNASATPGYLLVNRGLLPFINSEAELVAVLGHESGHLTARHANQAATQAKVAGAAVAVLTGVVAAKSNNGTTTALAIGAGGMGAAIGLSAYGRAQEVEADSLGRRYMQKLGYDPRESVHMVRAMQMYDTYQTEQATAFNNGEIAPTSLLDKLKSSHPATPARVAAAVSATGEPSELASPEQDLTGRARFMEAIQGLTFGPARRYGIARAGELVLTQQRMVVPLPAGAVTAYTGSGSRDALGTWLIGRPQGGAYLTVSAIKTVIGTTTEDLIRTMLPPFQRNGIMPLAVGPSGHPVTAYTATYHFLAQSKRYRILAVPAQDGIDQLLIITFVYPDDKTMQTEDPALLATITPLTFLTENQALKYKQLELVTFRAGVGQTVAQQAHHLPVGGLAEDLFRALNSLPEGTDMVPGQLYKTVTDPNL